MSGRLGRFLAPHGSAQLDVALCAALVTVDLTGLLVEVAQRRLGGPGRVAGLVAVAVACAGAFRWRRRRPGRLVVLVLAGYVVAGALHHPALVSQRTGAQIVLVVYALAAWSARPRLAAAASAGFGALAAMAAAHDNGVAAVVSLPVALVGAPWFAGLAARMRRRHLAGVEERLAAAEADREQRARRAVADERARIARELHDVVAHHVSLIGVQAGAARTTLGRDDDGTRRALVGIESSSREAVREMRQLLDVLGGPGEAPGLAPPPRRAEFVALCAGYRAAGLDVRCTSAGDLDAMPPLQALTLYRIVEEALTNVTRHSRARCCTVRLCADAHGCRATVSDPGPSHPRAPVPPPGAGRGLAGMRERVALFGGALVAGACDAGFTVDASLPTVRS